MGHRNQVCTITGTSPSSASTAVIGTHRGIEHFDWFTLVAILIGGTGTAGDTAWIQCRVDKDIDVWYDWLRFPAITAATTYKYVIAPQSTNAIIVTGTGTGASPGAVALAANTSVGGHPGDCIRLVYTAGASTSAGATQTLYLKGWRRRT